MTIPGPAALSWMTDDDDIAGASDIMVCAMTNIGFEARGGS